MDWIQNVIKMVNHIYLYNFVLFGTHCYQSSPNEVIRSLYCLELPLLGMSEDVLMARSMVDDVDVSSSMEIDIPKSVMTKLQHGLQKMMPSSSSADQG